MLKHFDRRTARADIALEEGMSARPAAFATTALVAALAALPPAQWGSEGPSPRAVAARRAGLRGIEFAAALEAAETGIPLPDALALARRTSSAHRWLAANPEWAQRWPTCSARTLATYPASFERFAALWSAVADWSRPFGSSCQPITPWRAAMLAARIPAGTVRGALAGAGLLALVQHAPDGEFPRMPSTQALREIGRGALWCRRWGHTDPLPPVRTLRILGRLSPELRHALMRGGLPEVARIQRLRAGGNVAQRAALLPGQPSAALRGWEYKRRPKGWHALDHIEAGHVPAYPLAAGPVARALLCGRAPQDIAAVEGMTRREAHEWLTETGGQESALRWLINRRLGELTDPGYVVRSVRVADWLSALYTSGRWGEFTRDRFARHPDGREVVWSVQQMLDEIDDADIVRLSDGPRAVAERAIARRSDAALAQWARQHGVIGYLPTWARSLPAAMRVLRTPAALVDEGTALHHCVGGYVEAVRRGQCVIIAVASRHGRSTVELSPDGLTVRQHYGAYNGAPPARHAQLLRAWHRRIISREDRHCA